MSRKRIFVFLTAVILSSVVIGLSFAGLCDYCTESTSTSPGNYVSSAGGVDYCICYWEIFGSVTAACCTDSYTLYDCDDIYVSGYLPYIGNYRVVSSHYGPLLPCYKKCNSIGASYQLYCGAWLEIDKNVQEYCNFYAGYHLYEAFKCR